MRSSKTEFGRVAVMTEPVELRTLQEQLNGLVNETISAEQFADLSATLKSSAWARQVYLDFLDIHYGLRKLERMEVALDPLERAIRQARSEDFGAGKADANRGFSWNGSRLPIPMIAFFAIAASLVLALSMIWLQYIATGITSTSIAESNGSASSAVPDGQVVLAQSVRASFFGELTPSLNSPMETNHEYALTSGIIELRFPAGATAILESPAVFSIAGVDKLVLQTGQCSVHAPDGAQGFQVDTPLTNIVDLGTRFSVAVDEAGETDVQVVEGIAEVFASSKMSRAGDQPIRLRDGERRVYSENAGVISHPTEYDDSQYRHRLPDRVVSYRATDPNGRGAVELVDVTVQRGGKIYTYPIESLIGIELMHFKSASGKNANPIAYSLGEVHSELDKIVSDRALNTGVINPGGAAEPLHSNPIMVSPESVDTPNTPGMAVRFRQPIVNAIGPDVVVFDLQTFTNPPFGDAFHVGPVSFEPGLRSHTVWKYDITLNSKEAKILESFGLMRAAHPIHCLQDLQGFQALPSRVHTQFRALSVGIDLSELGYESGATIDQLFIQDAMDDNDSFVDPVLIVGLPPVTSGGTSEQSTAH
jgi:hypothetical protein